MRYISITILLLLSATANLFAQKTKKQVSTAPWNDTTFIQVVLNDTSKHNKIIAVNIGRKAIIYVALNPVLLEAKENLSTGFVKEYYKNIIRYFDSAALKSDTIYLENHYYLQHLEFLISHQLTNGYAKVYYKKQNAFVGTITHRLERYGGDAIRFFYLPDNRPFFAVKEFSGILDDENAPFGKGRYDEYVREGEKLHSLRME